MKNSKCVKNGSPLGLPFSIYEKITREHCEREKYSLSFIIYTCYNRPCEGLFLEKMQAFFSFIGRLSLYGLFGVIYI